VEVCDRDTAQGLLELPFEDYVLLGQYLAYWDSRSGYIEAAFAPIGDTSQDEVLTFFGGADRPGHDEAVTLQADSAGNGTGMALSIGPASVALLPFAGDRHHMPVLSLKLWNILFAGQAGACDAVVDLLERVANSLFLEIELRFSFSLQLVRVSRPMRQRAPVSDGYVPPLHSFPSDEYEREPMAYYTYGRSAAPLPLLQFLAFYQVLEYYFQRYGRLAAEQRVRSELSRPEFGVSPDTDITALLEKAQIVKGMDRGCESDQLRQVLGECVGEDQVREFLTSDPGRRRYFAPQLNAGKNSKRRKDGSRSLRNAVADRIYAVRNSIVHPKDGKRDFILPYSAAAEDLAPAIELVRFLAQQVLRRTKRPLQLPVRLPPDRGSDDAP